MLEALLLLIAQITGITRTVDPQLNALAQQRSVEIISNFSHDGKPEGTAEVITWFLDDPADIPLRIAQNWMNSAPHRSILTNPVYNRIGCGITHHNGAHYAVCLFVAGRGIPNTAMPDTAMTQPLDWSLWTALGLLVAVGISSVRRQSHPYPRRIYGNRTLDR